MTEVKNKLRSTVERNMQNVPRKESRSLMFKQCTFIGNEMYILSHLEIYSLISTFFNSIKLKTIVRIEISFT